MGESKEVIPLVHFSHANLVDSVRLNARLDLIKIKNQPNSFLTEPNRLQSVETNVSGQQEHKTRHHRAKKLKLTVQEDEMNYEGIEEDECPFMLGLIPKDGERISLLDMSYFVLKPECYLSSNETNETDENKTSKTYSDKLNSLTAAFGSSKKRRAMQSKLKNKIDSSALEEAVSSAVKESMTVSNDPSNEENSISASIEQFSVLPTPNMNAKLPQDCYSLLDVFGFTQEEFDRYTNDSALWLADTKIETVKEWAKTDAHSDYVCDRLIKFASSNLGHKQRMNKFKLLSFMHYLVALFKLKQVQLKSKTALASSQVPDVVGKKLYEMYTTWSSGGGHKSAPTMPNRMRDKLAAHILVLALHIDDFSTDFRSFQKDLKMSIPRLSDFYLALGCHLGKQIAVVDGKKIMIKKAELKLPLVLVNRLEPKKRSRKDN